MSSNQMLTDEERAELEQLRAEKATREQAHKDAQERAELERLREASRIHEHEREELLRIQEARARGAKLMQPDDDLRMPAGQKAVLGIVALVALIVLVMTFFGG